MPRVERFLLNKLLTGEFRVGVAQTLVVRALAESAGVEADHRRGAVDGRLDAVGGVVRSRALRRQPADADPSQPYPFFLASPLEGPPETLGDRGDWLVEWKWDGIRAQLVRRARRRPGSGLAAKS